MTAEYIFWTAVEIIGVALILWGLFNDELIVSFEKKLFCKVKEVFRRGK